MRPDLRWKQILERRIQPQAGFDLIASIRRKRAMLPEEQQAEFDVRLGHRRRQRQRPAQFRLRARQVAFAFESDRKVQMRCRIGRFFGNRGLELLDRRRHLAVLQQHEPPVVTSHGIEGPQVDGLGEGALRRRSVAHQAQHAAEVVVRGCVVRRRRQRPAKSVRRVRELALPPQQQAGVALLPGLKPRLIPPHQIAHLPERLFRLLRLAVPPQRRRQAAPGGNRVRLDPQRLAEAGRRRLRPARAQVDLSEADQGLWIIAIERQGRAQLLRRRALIAQLTRNLRQAHVDE